MNRLVGFGRDVLNGWLNAEAFTLAAALAYYAIFAIAPLLLISISVAVVVPRSNRGRTGTDQRIYWRGRLRRL